MERRSDYTPCIASLGIKSARSQTAASTSQISGANSRIRVGLIGCGGHRLGRFARHGAIAHHRMRGDQCDVDDDMTAKATTEPEKQGAARPGLQVRDFRKVLDAKILML
ncbi:MAG: hypothetical protein WKF84_02400 [Pyrinomonadaceae bacterium]